MDSLTQIVLGAAVGELVLGKKIGRKAALWGAIGGTIPDLDVISKYFMSDIDGLLFHRGFMHSIFFVFLLGPLISFIPFKIYSKSTFSSMHVYFTLIKLNTNKTELSE